MSERQVPHEVHRVREVDASFALLVVQEGAPLGGGRPVTDPTERTVLEALHARPAFSKTTLSALETLGIDPSMSVAQLRADLAIAARARACTTKPSREHFGPTWVEVDGHLFSTPRALLAYLLNGEQP